ncbi:MAG: homocysteine S-methyltransferase family protein [Treponema sp.]|jgi:5-methyltetrahydrofolate--homocysteine methyltransferase|nr:homocysteine S-methyltransferase family protein [Treponema sp.]
MIIREQLRDLASQRILILDGAMGSILQRHALTEAEFRGERFAAHTSKLLGCNDVLCLSKPTLVSDIHEAYLKAGVDIIETCSFNANAVSLAGFGIAECAYEISFAAASLARKAADAWSTPEKPRFVAGSMGPTAKCAGIPSDFTDPAQRAITWDDLSAAYYDNARGLLDGGADLLLVETVIDSVNAKAALYAIGRLRDERGIDIPVMVSASIAHGGRILSGQTLLAFYVAMSHADPIAIGINCSFGATTMLPYLRQLAAVPCMVIAYPNAGMPNQTGDYDETPAIMAEAVAGFMSEGLVNIVGGCCGSTPEHIAAIVEKATYYRPRSLPKPSSVSLPLSGLEPCPFPEQVAYDNRVETLVAAGDYDEAVELLRSAVENGASYIALRLDKELPDAPLAMRTLVNMALSYPDIARLPFIIGGSCWSVVEAALKCLPGRGLVDARWPTGADAALIQRYGEVYMTNL